MLQPTPSERQNIVRAVFGPELVDYANSSRFESYFARYCSVVCPAVSGDAVVDVDTPALRSHADVLNCVQIIFDNPRISFNDYVANTCDPNGRWTSVREKRHVARVATEVAFGINCTLKDLYSDNFIDHGTHQAQWYGDMSFLSFIENAFQAGAPQVHTPESHARIAEVMGLKASLKAWKLTKRYGIKIRGTDNLLEHLVLDRKSMTLKVFHQVSFLRAHLAKSKDNSLDLGFEESLKR